MGRIAKWHYARLLVVPLALVLFTLWLWFLVINRPVLSSGLVPELHFPKSLEDLRALVNVLSAYKEDHWNYILLLFTSAYVYKQTFAIPGSALLNLMGGALIGCWPIGYPLCCILTAVGATNCFILSRLAGKEILRRKFASKILWLQEKISENDNRLFLFLISLRVFPMTPNWFLNMAAPIVNVPMHLFFFSVLFGLMPYNFLCVQAGEMLSEVQSMDDILTPKRLLGLITIALIMLTFSHFARKHKKLKA
ncbi:transmembrane protein 41A-like isoform X2 [Oratosquilla oratoria]